MIIKELQIQMANDPPYFCQFLVLTMGVKVLHITIAIDVRMRFPSLGLLRTSLKFSSNAATILAGDTFVFIFTALVFS